MTGFWYLADRELMPHHDCYELKVPRSKSDAALVVGDDQDQNQWAFQKMANTVDDVM